MFGKVLKFEFDFQRRNPVFWVAAGIFFLLTFGAMTVDNIQIGSGANVNANSPFAIIQIHMIWTIFYMFVTTAFVANVVVRDDETGFGPIIRSTRIGKFDYLMGRFTGAFLAAALAFASVPLAIWLGSLMPWLDQETLGPNKLSYYLYAYFLMGVPTVFLTAAIFFALATATRSMMATYVGVVVFLALYLLSLALVRDRPDLRETFALFDPFGGRAMAEVTRYWTAAERNGQLPAFRGILLENRLIWIGIGVAFLALAYRLYSFTDRGARKPSRRRQRRDAAQAAVAAADRLNAPAASGPLPGPAFGARTSRTQLWARTRFEARQVFKSPAYFVLIGVGLINAVIGLWLGGSLYGTPTYPVTRGMVPILAGSFSIIPLIIAIYYGGELVWRERDRKVHEIVDATPLPNWAYVIPKTFAVALVLITSVLISVVASLLVQTLKGYTDYELGKYFLWYILPTSFDVILFAALSVFVQALSPNKYAGWGIMVLYLILTIVAGNIGLEHGLYIYAQSPEIVYSDMNGAGSYWKGAWWFHAYWGAIAVLLLVAAHLLWRRGTETRLKPRLQRLPARLKGSPGLIAGAAALAAVLIGSWIFYNTNVLNEYRTRDAGEQYAADYEKRFLKYEKVPQPSITHAVLNVALYPDQTRAEVQGSYVFTNLTRQPIADLHIRNPDQNLRLTELNIPGAQRASADEKFGYYIYRLDRPMAPGESRSLSFRTSGDDRRLVGNGTFLNNMEIAPAIGMGRDMLLQDRAKRRKYGLPAELHPAKLEDLSATRSTYFGGGWTTADITVSTVADQTPIAPGRKIFDQVANGRRTARFVSDAPILTFFSIQSARYAERHRLYKGIDLGIYYHPAHAWNVDRMLNALQHGLDYYQANFGPYQFKQARIIEFPAYDSFAQAFANTMPYSEAIGFTADATDKDAIDYVTYVTAHELGHQWWAHQIIGADMQGGTMLSETLAQYSALMVMKHLYGEDAMRRFLKFELDGYLRRRGGEGIEEQPLERVENQQYIHYNKGSLVMYLLQDRLGEDAVNRALRSILDKYRFKGAPYPRSIELVDAFRNEAKTPEDKALVADLFERITVYDLKADAPTAVRRKDGKWDVTLPVEAHKYYADGKGNEKESAFADRIAIGLFTAEPGRGAFDRKNVVLMERRPVKSGRQIFRFVTAQKPSFAGVDPYNFYIDRNSDDNVAPVG